MLERIGVRGRSDFGKEGVGGEEQETGKRWGGSLNEA